MSYTKEEQIQNRKKWVAALRSGEYQQCEGTLRSGDSFCCLGVLTDLYLKEHNLSWIELDKDEEHAGYYSPSVDASPDLLSSEIQEYVGLRNEAGLMAAGLKSLAEMNDEGATFTQIANVIESEPDGLFCKD